MNLLNDAIVGTTIKYNFLHHKKINENFIKKIIKCRYIVYTGDNSFLKAY